MTDSLQQTNLSAAPVVVVSAPDDDTAPMEIDNQTTNKAFWNNPTGSTPFKSTQSTRMMFENTQNQFVESPKAQTPEDSGVVMSPENIKKPNNSLLEQFRQIQLSTAIVSKQGQPVALPRVESKSTIMIPQRIGSFSTPAQLPAAPQLRVSIPPPSVGLKPPIISNAMSMSPTPSPISENIRPRSAETTSEPNHLPIPQHQFRSSSHDSMLVIHSTEFICYAIFRFWHNASPPSLAAIQAFRQSSTPNASTEMPPVQWYPAFVTSVHRLLLSSGLHSHHHLSTVFLALLYVVRLRRVINPNDPKGPGSEYRVLAISLILAQKYLCDDRYSNATWAKLSGLDLAEMNQMETEFLNKISWGLHVTGYDWDQWLQAVKLVRAEHRRWAAGMSQGQSQDSYTNVRANSVGGGLQRGGPLTASLSIYQTMMDDEVSQTFTRPFQKR